VTSSVPPVVRGDASRVRQILLNLLGNAIKFTEVGEVHLRVSAGSRVDPDRRDAKPVCSGKYILQADTIEFDISDTGPGLNDEQQSRLFRRFEQADGARTAARYGGSGLGLAICQELAAAMGGAIVVDSAPGMGTRFTVRLLLPAAAALQPATGSTHEPARSQRPLSLLLVEDDPTVADVVTGLLRALGHRVVHVSHGLAALAEISTARFDAALLDLDLPGLDGCSLARQLRTQGITLPLIAITARADADAQPQAMAAGFDHFIRKPVTRAMLAALLVNAVNAHAAVLAEEADADATV